MYEETISLVIATVAVLIKIKTASCEKKCATPEHQGEKRCKIKGGGQEMAVIIFQWQKS